MANRRGRSPGHLRTFDETARIGGAPDFAVYTGQSFEALAKVAGSLSGKLGQLADDAARREGALAGLTNGARSGAAYLSMQASQAAASAKAGRLTPEQDAIVTAAALRHGVDPAFLKRTAAIESGGDPNAVSSTGAEGLFQFTRGTAKQYGLANRRDVAASADAAARLAADNANYLRNALGREPTPGELYLAHQQGAGGAAALLSNPTRAASDVVGTQAVAVNGGGAGMSAGQFAGLWTKKFADLDQGVTPDKSSVAAPPATALLPALPLQLRRDGTIYGEAYDRAAQSAYAWRMQAGLSAAMEAAFEANQDDPAALASALSEVHDQFARDQNLADPELAETFAKGFAQRSEAYIRAAQSKAETKMRGEERQAAFEGMAAQRSDVERQAFALGGNPEGDRLIGQAVERAGRSIDAAVAAGALTPAEGAKQKTDLAASTALARTRGTYDALPTPEEKEGFAQGLLDDWTAGKGPLAKLPFDKVKALSTTLWADARRQINERTADQKTEATRLKGLIDDDVASIEQSGKGLDPKESGLDAEQVEKLLGPAEAEKWRLRRAKAEAVWGATNGMEAQSAPEIAERLTVLEAAVRQGGPNTANAEDALKAATARAKVVLEARKKDPLSQAELAGIVHLTPIDLTTPETAEASIAARYTEAKQVAAAYGEPLTFFRPQESAGLAKALTTTPEAFPGFARALVGTMGKDAATALNEISPDAPALAHAAGLALASGDSSVAEDVATTLSAKMQKLYVSKMPSADVFARSAGPALGNAFSRSPQVRAAVLSTAELLFEGAANRLGFDPSKIGEEGTPAYAAWTRALDRATGGSRQGRTAYGGIGTVNGERIVVPAKMERDRPQTLIGQLSEDELKELPPVVSGNGVAITAQQLRGAHYVSVGDGLYRAALGDPDSLDPRWVMGAGGTYWTLDINRLSVLRDKRPSSGRPAGSAPISKPWSFFEAWQNGVGR